MFSYILQLYSRLDIKNPLPIPDSLFCSSVSSFPAEGYPIAKLPELYTLAQTKLFENHIFHSSTYPLSASRHDFERNRQIFEMEICLNLPSVASEAKRRLGPIVYCCWGDVIPEELTHREFKRFHSFVVLLMVFNKRLARVNETSLKYRES